MIAVVLKMLSSGCSATSTYSGIIAVSLLHIDTNKLRRNVRPSYHVTSDRRDLVDSAGWEFAHVAINEYSRVSFVQMHPGEHKDLAMSFLLAAVTHYKALGVKIKRLIINNG